MRTALIAGASFAIVCASALGQTSKGMRFWNLTLQTVTNLQLSPTGKQKWGPNQCNNDRDGAVDHDERLRITGVHPGRYDVKLADKSGRVCIVRGIEVKDGAVFTIDEKQLTDCRK